MNHLNRVRLSKLSLGLMVALAAAPVFAQSTSAGITGQVTSADGKPVAGAEVTITHLESGTVSRAVTDANGRYLARGLRVGGPYTISINKAGAGTDTEDNVYLGLDQINTVNAQLKNDVTTVATVVVVGSAGPVAFDSSNKGMGTNLSRKDLDNTPMPGRSIQDVARLDPRVVVTDQARGEISAMGQNSRFNNISVDAVGVNDPFGLEANGLPYVGTPISIDTIQEYNVATANYDVTTRRAIGANINAVTKSGTNDFKGSVYYSYTDAKNLTSDKPALFGGYKRKWDGGFTLGGPIIKDKLFFFAGYEKSEIIGPGPIIGPSDSNASTKIPGLTTAQINQIIQIAQSKGLRPGDLSASSVNTDSKRAVIKFDWNINDAHRASLRYNRVDETEPVINGFSNTSVALSSYWYQRHRKNDNYVLNLYDDWSDSFSTEASISYTDYFVLRNGLLGDMPQVVINLGGGTGAGTAPTVNLGEEQFSHLNELGVKTWRGFFAGTWFTGSHSVKFGFDYNSDKIYNLFGRTQYGAYIFNGIANFQSGNYYQYDLYRPAPGYTIDDVAARWTLNQWGLFIQDDWKVTDRLSVQYGLRYDLAKTSDKPIYNQAFFNAFGFRNDNTVDGKSLLQPRVSFNYQFDSERLAQLRGGLGLFQGQALGVWLTNPYQNNGITVKTYSIRNSANKPAVSAQYPFSNDPYNQVVPPPASAQMAVDTLAPGFKQPSVWKGSLGLDVELPWDGIVATAEWEGLRVKDGIFYRNLNIGAPTATLPDGRFSYYCLGTGGTIGTPASRNRCNANSAFAQAVTVLDNTKKGEANYLTFSLKRPFKDDWSWSLAYTHGYATEVNPATSSQASSNFSNNWWVNPNEDVASISNYSIRDRVTASFTWQHRFFGNYVTSVSAFYDGHTGQPYSWVFGNDANGDSYARDLVYIPRMGDVNFTATTPAAAIQQFWDFIASDPYLRTHQGQIAERNRANSPWVNRLDVSLRQELPGLMAGHKAEIRLDVYNFLNALNKKWGQEERISFPFGRTLANYEGVDPDGKYIYSLPVVNGQYTPTALGLYDTNAISRWQVRVTLRYTF